MGIIWSKFGKECPIRLSIKYRGLLDLRDQFRAQERKLISVYIPQLMTFRAFGPKEAVFFEEPHIIIEEYYDIG